MNVNFTNQDLLHVKKGKVEYLQFKKLLAYQDTLVHAISLRHGGVSEGIYDSLNFRMVGKDDPANIKENLRRFTTAIGISDSQIYKGKQTHSDHIQIIDQQNKMQYAFVTQCQQEIDGYVTNDKGIASLVTTADCNPIILYDPVQHVVANIHSGWKGTIQKIYIKGILAMKENFGTNPSDVIACVGPSIGKCCFSSEDPAFKEKFTTVWPFASQYISNEEGSSRFHIDLPYLIEQDLVKIGVQKENIVLSHICTMCHHDSFYSYRFATKAKYPDFGTMATITMIS